MVSKEQKKIERVINFMKKGLTSLADDLEETVKGINDFIKSLAKAQKDLKEVTFEEEVVTVSTSSKKIVSPTPTTAKTKAASTLFSLLSGSGKAGVPATATAAAAPNAPPAAGSPPKAPSRAGPPKAPAGQGPPKAPSSGGPPARGNLPPAPKLPPAPSPGSGPPAVPGGGPPTKPPSFAKRPGPPAAPTGGSPPMPPSATAAPVSPVAPKAGGGLSSLRDEMLDELNRLKKIMRGE
ncbi:MAG: hypothetical protein ACFFA6_03540 [Promethearchaeota archaeon]